MSFSIVILAAGKGTRMRSALPKVLQPLGGQPMLAHVLELADQVRADSTAVVIGHGAEEVKQHFSANETEQNINWVSQTEQLGTGHAVLQAVPVLPESGVAVVLYGDVPLVTPDTLQSLAAAAEQGLAVLTVTLNDPTGYGRIVRQKADESEQGEGALDEDEQDQDKQVVAIVEQKDATQAQLEINEVNTGLVAAPVEHLRRWLPALSNDNAQGEYYLTDIVAAAVADGVPVQAVQANHPDEVAGVNDRVQLAAAEAVLRERRGKALMTAGVTLADPQRIDIRGRLDCGQDVFLDVNTVFEGDVQLCDNVVVGVGCVLRNCTISAGTQIAPYTVIDDAIVGKQCTIGPFARLRPGAELANEVHVGNYVEIKKSTLGHGSKANHLTYIGDAQIGSGVNVGAGTITCNYDGANKFATIIEDGAFIGSGTELVAPIRVGAGATTGAGATLTKDVPASSLAVERARTRVIENWSRPAKIKK